MHVRFQQVFMMYYFRHNYNNVLYHNHNYYNLAKLLFAETDSMTYKTKTNYVYEDFQKNKAKFDFSGYKIQSFMTRQTKK